MNINIAMEVSETSAEKMVVLITSNLALGVIREAGGGWNDLWILAIFKALTRLHNFHRKLCCVLHAPLNNLCISIPTLAGDNLFIFPIFFPAYNMLRHQN